MRRFSPEEIVEIWERLGTGQSLETGPRSRHIGHFGEFVALGPFLTH